MTTIINAQQLTSTGAQLHTYRRPPATVVAISGEIDACNAAGVSDYLAGFIHHDHPLIIDLSGLDFLGLEGYRAIVGFGAQRRIAQRPWVAVTNDAANILLHVLPDFWLPAVQSMAEALPALADVSDAPSLL